MNLDVFNLDETNYVELSNVFSFGNFVVKTAAEMQKTILMDSETLLRKVLSGIVQSDTEEN